MIRNRHARCNVETLKGAPKHVAVSSDCDILSFMIARL
jgi:hypothetical protein